MIFRYLLLFFVFFLFSCQSTDSYDGVAVSYEESKKILSDKSHSFWERPKNVRDFEIDICVVFDDDIFLI